MHPAISARGVSRRVDPEVVLEQDRLRRSNLRTVRFSFATAAYSLFLLHIVLYTFADFPNKGLDTTLAAVPFGAVVAAPALVLAGPVRTCVACLSCTLLGCILGVAFAAAALTGYDSTTLAVYLDFARSLGGTGVGSLYTMVAIESVALINQRESIVRAAAVTLTMQALGSFMAVGGGQMLGDRVRRTTAGLILLILGCLASLGLIVRRLQTPHPMLAYYRTFSTHSALRTVLPVAALAWRGTLVTGVPWLLYDFCFYTLNSMLSSSLRSVSAQGSTASTSFGNAAASTIVFSAFTAAAYAGSIAMARYVNSLRTCVRLQTGGFLAMAVAFGVVWAIVGATSSGATIALAMIVPYAICALIVNVTTFALASAWATLAEPASIPVFAFAAALGKVGAIVGSVVLNAVGLHGPPSAWTTTAHSDMLLTFALVSAAGAAATEALWRLVAAERMGWHIFAPVSKASLEGRSPTRDLEQSLLATPDEKERCATAAAAAPSPANSAPVSYPHPTSSPRVRSEPMGAFVSQRWWIPDMMLQLGDKLGAGGSGQVYRARLQGIGVAAKEVFEATLSDGAELRTLVVELEALRTLHHPGLVTLYGVCAMEGFSAGTARYMIVMELMPLSLRRALAAVRNPGAQDQRAALVAGEWKPVGTMLGCVRMLTRVVLWLPLSPRCPAPQWARWRALWTLRARSPLPCRSCMPRGGCTAT